MPVQCQNFTVLHHNILHCQCTALYCHVSTLLYCTDSLLQCTVMSVLYYTALSVYCSVLQCQYFTILHCQCNSMQSSFPVHESCGVKDLACRLFTLDFTLSSPHKMHRNLVTFRKPEQHLFRQRSPQHLRKSFGLYCLHNFRGIKGIKGTIAEKHEMERLPIFIIYALAPKKQYIYICISVLLYSPDIQFVPDARILSV